jgi:hypothetical protein
LVGDILESSFLDGDGINTNGEKIALSLLSFLGKCVDVKVQNKIFISFSKLSDRLKVLADTHGINLVEIRPLNEDGNVGVADDDDSGGGGSSDFRSQTDYVSQTADTIYRLYRNTVNTKGIADIN